jgi:hypothetical protein
MKISIDTLPLWDAFKQTDICPFCHLENRLEELFLESYLGESVMEPDTRLEVNAKGFCPEHFRQLYRQKSSKLGLALMTHTHLLETIKSMDAQMGELEKSCGEASSLLKRASGSRDIGNALGEADTAAVRRAASCVVCERVGRHMERYYETAQHMWEHDADFKTLFGQTEGFCLPHWGGQLLSCKGAILSKKQIEFIHKLNEMEKKFLSDLEGDVEWFTRKFDYRNANKPWGNSKDALPRAINALEGYTVKSES